MTWKSEIKKETETLNLDLKENPDIIKIISQKTDATIIAFALETDQGKQNAKNKLKNKNADFVVLNYANEKGAGFNTNTNHVYIYSKDGKEIELKKDRKDRIAHKIIEWVLN